MSRNIGIGTSAKLVIAPNPLLITWMMPVPPPMKSTAATRLVAKNAIATGTPSIISPIPRPKRITAAQYHSMGLLLLRLPGEAAEEIFLSDEETQKLDRHHRER